MSCQFITLAVPCLSRRAWRRYLLGVGALAGVLVGWATEPAGGPPGTPVIPGAPPTELAPKPPPANSPVVTLPTLRAPHTLPPESPRLNARVRAVAKVLPSVVNISTERVVTQSAGKYDSYDPFAELFNQFLGLQEPHKTTSSLGSGVIVEASGLVLTNEHVIRKASRIIVYLSDGTSYDATPVATDISNDLALLKLDGVEATRQLAAIEFARPDDLLLGEDVIAVGNPYGLGHSVSNGVLSAVARKFTYKGRVIFDDILQTDAAINPGNSGGPLVNADGQLIGLSLAIQRDAEGIGFAIPLKRLEEILGVWLIPSRFGLNHLGVAPGTRVLPDHQTEAVIREVREGSPAARAGLQPGQVVRAVNEQPVTQAIEISRLLWRFQAGETVRFTLANGTVVPVVLERIPELSGEEMAKQKLLLDLQELTPRLAAALRLPYARGLVVSGMAKGSALEKRGLQRGDVIIQIGEVPVANFTDLYRALSAIHHGDVVEVVIHRLQYTQGLVLMRRYSLEVPF